MKIFSLKLSKTILFSSNKTYHAMGNNCWAVEYFLGSILLIGVLKGKNSHHREFWSKNYGYEIIKKSISCSRFEEISQCLKFEKRHIRYWKDKLAPVNMIFEKIVEKCKKKLCAIFSNDHWWAACDIQRYVSF